MRRSKDDEDDVESIDSWSDDRESRCARRGWVMFTSIGEEED